MLAFEKLRSKLQLFYLSKKQKTLDKKKHNSKMKRQIWVFCDLCVIYPLFENIEFSFSGKERNFAPFKKLLFCHCHHHRYLEKTNKHNVYVLVVKQYNYCLDSKKQTKLYFINLHTKDIPVHHNFLQTWKTNKNYKPKNKRKESQEKIQEKK